MEKFFARLFFVFTTNIRNILLNSKIKELFFLVIQVKSKKGELCQKPSKLDEVCKTNHIEHRLTQPNTPKTNGMAGKANGIIKKETGLKENYANKEEMNEALTAFLVYYMLYRRHGGVRKEPGVKNPFQAVEKSLC